MVYTTSPRAMIRKIMLPLAAAALTAPQKQARLLAMAVMQQGECMLALNARTVCFLLL
jgi:hypothetical protein